MIGLGGFVPVDEGLLEDADSDEIKLELDSSYDEASEAQKRIYQWNIYYHFTGAVRNNKPNGKTYGSKGVTFQNLFRMLIKQNSNINFIDNYINTVLPYTDVGDKMKEWLSSVEDSVIYMYSSLHKRKDGNLNRRYRRDIRAYLDLTEELEGEQNERGLSLAREIKADIEAKVSTGSLPLSPAWNLYSTKLRRLRADLPMNPRFYASGQFIKNLKIICRFEKRRSAWRQDTME